MNKMSLEEKAENYRTFLHIEKVRNYINKAVFELLRRGELHDQSKMQYPEVQVLAKHGHKISKLKYGSKEYEENRKKIKAALDHHYDVNSHHPEFYFNGINGMNLFDIMEMFLDWKAASEMTKDGDMMKSIEINGKRFNISDQLITIFENTAKFLFKE